MRRFLLVFAAVLCAAVMGSAQETFRWVDFHPIDSVTNHDTGRDEDVVVWVTRALAGEKWTAIREIGVQWDAALVVTTERASLDASPADDTFRIWSVSLKNKTLIELVKGVNLRWLPGLQLVAGQPEPAVLYDDCRQCAATTYLTAFHYDAARHAFTARWLRGAQGAPVWTASSPADVTLTQVYAVLPVTAVGNQAGSEFLATWNHFDFGKAKPAQDYVFKYDRDPMTGLDRFLTLSGKDAEAMKARLCSATGTETARGQDSELCSGLAPQKRAERRPVTTPPANAQGRSVPPSAKASKPKPN